MKRIFFAFFAVFLVLSCATRKEAETFVGLYECESYGASIEFNAETGVLVYLNGEEYTATYLDKGETIEIWQERKTPPLILKKIDTKTLMLLNRVDLTETNHIFRKKN